MKLTTHEHLVQWLRVTVTVTPFHHIPSWHVQGLSSCGTVSETMCGAKSTYWVKHKDMTGFHKLLQETGQ